MGVKMHLRLSMVPYSEHWSMASHSSSKSQRVSDQIAQATDGLWSRSDVSYEILRPLPVVPVFADASSLSCSKALRNVPLDWS